MNGREQKWQRVTKIERKIKRAHNYILYNVMCYVKCVLSAISIAKTSTTLCVFVRGNGSSTVV